MIASVLIVDDDEEVRRMLSAILEDDGYSVEAVDNGRHAIKTCEKLPFDAALVTAGPNAARGAGPKSKVRILTMP